MCKCSWQYTVRSPKEVVFMTTQTAEECSHEVVHFVNLENQEPDATSNRYIRRQLDDVMQQIAEAIHASQKYSAPDRAFKTIFMFKANIHDVGAVEPLWDIVRELRIIKDTPSSWPAYYIRISDLHLRYEKQDGKWILTVVCSRG